jgi:Protein of unknown function (DUF1353)
VSADTGPGAPSGHRLAFGDPLEADMSMRTTRSVQATGRLAMEHRPWAWLTATGPFSALNDPGRPASFVFEQISDDSFRIPERHGFQYNAVGGEAITVTRDTLPSTDFASIPRYMSWFVSRYGRHTPAVLVHDELVTDGMEFDARKRADRLFLQMMDDLEVPPVQSRVMWTAVTLATRFRGPRAVKAGTVLWAVLAAIGIGALVWGLVTLNPWLIVAALVAPAIAAVLWGDQRSAGLVAGYALPVIAVPALVSLGGYWIYWVIEKAVKVIRQRKPENRGEPLPEPVGYQGR